MCTAHHHSSSRNTANQSFTSQKTYSDTSRSGISRQDSLHSKGAPTREDSKKSKPKRHLGYASVERGWQPPSYSSGVQTSFNWRSGRPMAGMLELERSRTRRERTFIGSECAVCEEPLEHTLRGERILQFSCGHVSHEACFYEYIKEFDSQYCPTCNAPLGLDTSRGGNVLDLGSFMLLLRRISCRTKIRSRKTEQYCALCVAKQRGSRARPAKQPKYTNTMGQSNG